jgi:hypothetical protein
MKQQLEMTELAERVNDDRFHKADFVTDKKGLDMLLGDRTTVLSLRDLHGEEVFHINKHCHKQIANRLKIPKVYYDRLLTDHPDLLADQVTHLFDRENERRMVRTLNGTARGFLSDKFRLDMDNYDVANAAIPILAKIPEMKIVSAGVTDTRMYLKAAFPQIRAEVKKGDIVTAGIVISNSEVGEGSLRIEALIFRLWCLNGMISGELLKKYHVGARHGLDDATYAVLTQETRDKTAEAMRSIITDVTTAATDVLKFEERVAGFREAATDQIQGDVVKGLEVLGNSLNLTQIEQADVLKQLIQGGDTSRWGLANAVTRAAADVDDYDRATEMERMGGAIIELNPSEWAEVAQAA